MIGSVRQLYAPTYVEDVVETLARFALDPTKPIGTFALAGPDTLTVDECVDVLNGTSVKERHLGRRLARVIARVHPPRSSQPSGSVASLTCAVGR